MTDFIPSSDLYPFTSRWFDSSAGRLHYIDEGRGPALLFCHGSPTWSFLYRNVIRELRDQFRCIAVDMLGFGLSDRPLGFGYRIAEQSTALGELVDARGLDRGVVVGHDWGGPVSLDIAVRRPDRIRGITLSNTVYWPLERLANRAFSAVMGSRLLRRPILQRNLLVERFLIDQLGDHLATDAAQHYRAVQSTPSERIALTVMPREIRSAWPLLSDLNRAVPDRLGDKTALAVWGMRDPVFRPADCLPHIRADFTDLKVVELSDVGHFVPEEAAHDLASAIRERFA